MTPAHTCALTSPPRLQLFPHDEIVSAARKSSVFLPKLPPPSRHSPANTMYWILGVLLVASCAVGQDITCSDYDGDCNLCQTNNCSYVNCTITSGAEVFNCTASGNETDACANPVTVTECTAVTDAPETTASPTTQAPTTPNVTTTGQTTLPPSTQANTTAKPTTPTPSTQPEKTTPGPSAGPTSSPQMGGFDAASFIGGIVLCGGLIALIFFGCKFWKSRSSPNYHTFSSVSFGRKEAKRKHTSKPPAKLSISADDIIEAEDPTTDTLDHHVGVLRIYDDEEDQDHIRSGLPESDRDRGRNVSAERERGTIPQDFMVREFHDEPSDEEPSDDEMLAY
ncbi:porimin-like isoform X2 [Branchiostoma lanceolatum]|uniref:porimin-like isoform X2 n=1 Tax=Branchiostoma lanceolatum TaxID=7740 RepID=UPI0034555C1F